MAGKVDSTTHAAAIARAGEAVKHEVQVLAYLDEIVKGPAFKGSHRAQDFLRYVVEQALHGDAANLRERSIGVALFGRQAAYDTADDAIVRVTASDVRKRLLQHYGNSGPESPLRITLPSGSYVPEFSFAPGPAATGTDVAGMEPAPEIMPILEPATPRRPRRLHFRKAAGALFVLAAALTAYWTLAGKFLEGNSSQSLILAAFQGSPRSAQVVVADDALVLIEVLLDRRFTLEEYENLAYMNVPDLVQKRELLTFWRSLSTRQITNAGDLQNAHRIARDLESHGWETTIRLARQMHARSFRTGNFVILGSSFSNPWADLFVVDDSAFPLVELPKPGKPEVFLNPHPKSGEPTTFEAHVDPQTGKKMTFARVSILENSAHSGRVLLVAGQSVSATELSGEFLLRAGSASRIRQMLGLASNAPIPDLEMMLRVSERNEVGDSVDPVACRKVSRRPE